MPRFLVAALLAPILLSPIWAVEAEATTLSFGNGTFDPADWSFQLFNFHTGGSATPSQALAGGNPDSYQQVAYATNAATDPNDNAAIYVFHALDSAVVDPSTDGAIASVDYSWDVSALSGSGVFSGPALMQGGNVYVSAGLLEFTGTSPQWRSVSRIGVLDVNYGWIRDILEIDPTQDPDFSSSGAPITFGYFSALAGGLGGGAINGSGGFDNWSVDVHLVPQPRILALLALAVGALAVRRRPSTAWSR